MSAPKAVTLTPGAANAASQNTERIRRIEAVAPDLLEALEVLVTTHDALAKEPDPLPGPSLDRMVQAWERARSALSKVSA